MLDFSAQNSADLLLQDCVHVVYSYLTDGDFD